MSKKEENQMDIDYVSNLARIELSEEEKTKFHGQLEDVLTYFKKLQTVQTENVEPTAHAFPRYNVWDIDETKEPSHVKMFSETLLHQEISKSLSRKSWKNRHSDE